MLAKTIEKQTAKLPSDSFFGWHWFDCGFSNAKNSGRQKDALFVGQWAPTFLVLGVYNKLVKQLGSDRAENGLWLRQNQERSTSGLLPTRTACIRSARLLLLMLGWLERLHADCEYPIRSPLAFNQRPSEPGVMRFAGVDCPGSWSRSALLAASASRSALLMANAACMPSAAAAITSCTPRLAFPAA